jgi:hypothetical protein
VALATKIKAYPGEAGHPAWGNRAKGTSRNQQHRTLWTSYSLNLIEIELVPAHFSTRLSSPWFEVIGKQLSDPVIVPENVYNMDETGVLLSVLTSLKVLVGTDDLRSYRGAGVKRTLITAIECVSADGRSLFPLIVWPAATHRSTWTTYPTPGWHFTCSKSEYTDSAISLHWIQHVFDPLTRHRATRSHGYLYAMASARTNRLKSSSFVLKTILSSAAFRLTLRTSFSRVTWEYLAH